MSTTTESFWACSTQRQNGTFRVALTGADRASSYDIINDRWGNSKVHIESGSNDYNAPERGREGMDWRVESAESIVLSSTRAEFSASNFRFSSIVFDQARNRFSAIDSNGVGIGYARVRNTSDP